MLHRVFSERLNRELNDIGMPERFDERIDTFVKVFKTPRFKAAAILSGSTLPDEALLRRLASELEVNANWLLGREQSKH